MRWKPLDSGLRLLLVFKRLQTEGLGSAPPVGKRPTISYIGSHPIPFPTGSWACLVPKKQRTPGGRHFTARKYHWTMAPQLRHSIWEQKKAMKRRDIRALWVGAEEMAQRTQSVPLIHGGYVPWSHHKHEVVNTETLVLGNHRVISCEPLLTFCQPINT